MAVAGRHDPGIADDLAIQGLHGPIADAEPVEGEGPGRVDHDLRIGVQGGEAVAIGLGPGTQAQAGCLDDHGRATSGTEGC
jgi:hypothetical protein